MTKNKYYFESIDLLRGFSAISVVIYHFIEHFQWSSFPASGPLIWFRTGWMGVDFFFVISGFVIGISALSEIDKFGPTKFRSGFFSRRLSRIVPLHYLTMLIFIALVSPEIMFTGFWKNLVAHLLFIHNLTPGFHGAINGSNWSLAAEMQFYCLMLIVAPWIRTTSYRSMIIFFVGAAWIWRYGVTLLISPSIETGPFTMFVAATQLPGMLDEFVAGLLLAKFVKTEKGESIIQGGLITKIGLFIFSAVLTTISMIIYWRYASFWDHKWMVVFWRTLIACAFMLIISFSISIEIKGVIRKFLSPFFYLGTISYGVYLWHLPVLLSLKRLEWIEPRDALQLGIVLTLLLASVSWHFFERPIIEKFK